MRRALTGIDEARLAEAGLIKGEARGAPRDHFFNRLVFPITDPRGRVIAFGGRVLGEGGPKYLNSPDTPLFRKGRVLYGLATAREAARRRGALIVAEGYMDVLALAGAGIEHAVAPLGTALTEEQILLMWRLADEPTLCFDGDDAGERAALRAAERALPLVQARQVAGVRRPAAGRGPRQPHRRPWRRRLHAPARRRAPTGGGDLGEGDKGAADRDARAARRSGAPS